MKNLFCDVIRICIINYGRPEQVLVLSGFIYVTFECWKKWSGCILVASEVANFKVCYEITDGGFQFQGVLIERMTW